jgi:hypothetical protein
MKILKYKDEKEWLEDRFGRVTGKKAGGLVSKRNKSVYLKGFYELLAERIALPPTEENVMFRGHRLEEEAIDLFTEITGKKVIKDLVMFCRDDNENIAYSPDGYMQNEVIDEDVEVKCLNSADFIQIYLSKEIPKEFKYQNIQAFLVNDDLKVRYWVFYDPRMPVSIFWIESKREDVQKDIDEYLQLEREVLAKIDLLEKEFTF